MDKTEKPSEIDLALALFAGPPPGREFEFRRRKANGEIASARVRVQLLRIEENLEAMRSAQRFAKSKGELPAEYGDVYRESQAHELIWRFTRRPEVASRDDGTEWYRPLFATPDQLRSVLGESECQFLLNCYEIVKAEFADIESFEEGQIERWAAALSDPSSEVSSLFFARLDWRDLPRLCRSLALELRALRAEVSRPLPDWRGIFGAEAPSSEPGTGSPGQPPTEPSPAPADPEGIPSRGSVSRADARRWLRERAKRGGADPAD